MGKIVITTTSSAMLFGGMVIGELENDIPSYGEAYTIKNPVWLTAKEGHYLGLHYNPAEKTLTTNAPCIVISEGDWLYDRYIEMVAKKEVKNEKI